MKLGKHLIIPTLFFMIAAAQGVTMDYQKISLNGKWQIQPGEKMPDKYHYSVAVPGLVDVAQPDFDWTSSDYFWYQTTFQLSQISKTQNVYLQLEQVKYGTQVWVNGHLAGSDIPCYTSQEFDITEFLKTHGDNDLVIRVGTKQTLPEESPVGNDFEKVSFIPGIWGDVWLHVYGNVRAEWTRIIPDIRSGKIAVRSDLQNLSTKKTRASLTYRVIEKISGNVVFDSTMVNIEVPAGQSLKHECKLPVRNFKLWSPDNPFLYVLETEIVEGGRISQHRSIPFGMREFQIRGSDFYLNDKRIVLKGSNIAFHRMLSDKTRGLLPWQPEWITKVLAEIPKEHNMFFFRFHLGHAYNRWYDIADEQGIMLQDEWMFWTITGSPQQTEKEFSTWIKENCNHPSIVIWDALNESSNEMVTGQLIPKMKELDPTRPWELVDFPEDHPYIYSLGPVLNDRKFGFSRSIFDLQKSDLPTMVNEYVWFWLDRDGNPTSLTDLVTERWLGPDKKSKDELENYQAFLLTELTELWLRLDLDAIMPFVYLSIGEGATGNWFNGPLSELNPKKVLQAAKNVFAPVGVSIELWDRHFCKGEQRNIPVYLFNDTNSKQSVFLSLTFDTEGSPSIFKIQQTLEPGEHRRLESAITFDAQIGEHQLIASIYNEQKSKLANSRKPVRIYGDINIPQNDHFLQLSLRDLTTEVSGLLRANKVAFQQFPEGVTDGTTVFLNGTASRHLTGPEINLLTNHVKNGGILLVQEPETGIESETEIRLLNDLSLYITPREDADRGGYDSFVFFDDPLHPLLNNLSGEDFKMFNGGLGGEIISQYNVRPTLPFFSPARCNLSLKVPAVLEIPYGKGWVVVSRIQIRGRLEKQNRNDDLFSRRYDPVAEHYFWNLLTAYQSGSEYHQNLVKKLADQKIYVARSKASSGEVYDALDKKMNTRWAGEMKDPQWIWLDLGHPTQVKKITMYWEVAYGKKYEILASDDDKTWHPIFKEIASGGGIDVIPFENITTRFLKFVFQERGTQWGYSIWELELE